MSAPTPTRASVRAAREAWIAYLAEPGRRGHRGRLASFDEAGARCCLGHACAVLDPDHSRTSWQGSQISLPEILVAELGMWDCSGGPAPGKMRLSGVPDEIAARGRVSGQAHCRCLSDLNDIFLAEPGEIAAYLRSVLGGGPETPFRPLTDFPE